MTLSLVDIGANLTHDSFDRDRPEVIARARAAGVCHMVVTGADADSSAAAAALCESHPGLLSSTAGVHPHHARDYDAERTPARLRALLSRPDTVAVGECGLDYFRNFSPQADQLRAFESQLDLAIETGKPVFLHQRDAHADFTALLRRFRNRLGACVVHCFTGDKRELHDYLDLDLHIGITGWLCDERRGGHLRELVKHIPAERLMLETDAPYLLPRDLKPVPKDRRNEPANLPHILRVLAVCRAQPAEQLAIETTHTAREFFGLRHVAHMA
ncbi:MAG TPA: TatD family hydrolase [Gammaproteobacteria bacterium]|nr:TatD family hydrolase [Gammaproteobacteria bacterium]